METKGEILLFDATVFWIVATLCFIAIISLCAKLFTTYRHYKSISNRYESNKQHDLERIKRLEGIIADIRTPLTLIQAPLKQLMDDNNGYHAAGAIKKAYDQSTAITEIITTTTEEENKASSTNTKGREKRRKTAIIRRVENEIDYPTDGFKILCIDSNAEMVKFFSSSLQPHFKRIISAKDGEKGYEIAIKELPDIIITEIALEKINGYELCHKLKKSNECGHIPIILLSSDSDRSCSELGYKSGADMFITKPFELPSLLSALRSILCNRERTRLHHNRSYNHSTTESHDSSFSNSDEQFIIKLNDYIFDNIDKEIDVDSIARHMCMSRALLYKKLKSIINTGAMEYVTKIRLTSAANKLRETELSVAEIAIQSGYTDNQYFSKAFKQFHDHSPSKYRKLHANQ